MTVYCVMDDRPRYDLDHVVFATTNKEKAEEFAKKYDYLNFDGEPNIEELDVEEN